MPGECPSGAVVVLKVPPTAELAESTEDASLKENLRAMVNDANYSDVQFVCSDGELGIDKEGTSCTCKEASKLVQYMADKIEVMAKDSQSLGNLSARAMSLYLKSTAGLSVSRFGSRFGSFSLREYLRLRSILLWACSNVSYQAEVLLKQCLPDEKRLPEIFQTIKSFKNPTCDFEPPVSQEVQMWVEKLEYGWTSVRFRDIHPQLLDKVVTPLQLVPSDLVVSALIDQALSGGEMPKLKWWGPARRRRVTENRLVMACKAEPDAAGFLNMLMNHGLYEWEITVGRPCPTISILLWDPSVPHGHGVWCLSQRGVLMEHGCPEVTYGQRFGHEGSKVRVQVNMTCRTCAFTIDGVSYGEAWSNLPRELVVGVHLAYPGEVEVQLISHPNFT